MAESPNHLERFIALEKKHDVEAICVNGIPVWTYLRVYVHQRMAAGHEALQSTASSASLFASLFRGVANLFRSHRYWVISSSDQRKQIDGRWTDRHDMAETLRKEALFIELPNPVHQSSNASQHLMSKTWFYALELLHSKWPGNKVKVSGKSVLDDLCKEAGITFDLDYHARKFWAQYRVTRFFLRWKKPKAVFLTTYYTNSARVFACKELGIPVVESQHGLVSRAHLAYQLTKADPRLLPDYYLSYGTQEVGDMEGSAFKQHVEIIPTGHFYLNHVSQQAEMAKPEGVRYRIVVTAQDIFEGPFIQWMNTLSEMLTEDELILIPRRKSVAWYRELGLSERVRYIDGDTYHLIRSADIHSTVFSSCAVEAIGLERPNILINLDNRAREVLSYLEYPSTATHVAETPQEFSELVNSGKFKEGLDADPDRFFKAGYATNLADFLKKLGA